MTVGEKIQMLRKQLGMSQDELGQKLLVSRQTISLWEKGQTVPTIDNLIKLREIFEVSTDEILGFERDSQGEKVPVPAANEAYQFHYTNEELHQIFRLQRRPLYKKALIFTVLCLLLILSSADSPTPNPMTPFLLGVLCVGAVFHIKSIRAYHQMWKNTAPRIGECTYGYELFDTYILVTIYRNGEAVHWSKCHYSDIAQIQPLGKWLFLQFGGQTFILRRDDLKENSALFSYMYKNPAKTTEIAPPARWKIAADILFWASLLSIYGALTAVAKLSDANHLFTENMWVFFLMAPIPIASLVLGLSLKKRGFRHKKNIIAGIIVTALLCIYGSFSFIFVYDHSDEPILRAEQVIGIDLPTHEQVRTHHGNGETQTSSGDRIYTTSEVFISDAEAELFEKQLATDSRWLSSVPNDLIGITSAYGRLPYDYTLIYNIDTSQCNTLPADSGTFRFINIFYLTEINQMKIVEYDIDYTK